MINRRRVITQVASVVFGALPATVLGVYAAMLFLVAFEPLPNQPLAAVARGFWGLAGVIGVIGAWLIIFDLGCHSVRSRRVVVACVVAGIGAAVVLLGWNLYEALFRANFLAPFQLMPILAPVLVGIYQIYRVTGTSLGRGFLVTALGILAVAGLQRAEPLYTDSVTIERIIEWECWHAQCDPSEPLYTHRINYAFPGQNTWYEMERHEGLLGHLQSLGRREVRATLRVHTRFGRFDYFRIVDVEGFSLGRGSARNGNQPRPPYPSAGIDGP